jgi:hypothetical protein
MEQSILKSVKKLLGITDDYTAFDLDILIHINSAFATLHQLGVGPDTPFEIEDASAVWADFLESKTGFGSVKTYIFLKVRSIFDPPQSGYAVTAMKEQILEYEWRLNTVREMTDWVDPEAA